MLFTFVLMNQKEKYKLLEQTAEKINKDFGEGSMMSLSDKSLDRDMVSTGSLGLDHAMGTGGWVRGRVYEIYGPESSGKTTLAIHAIAEVQKAGGTAVIVDTEHSFDKSYAKDLGVDVDHLMISQPDYGEQALNIVDTLATKGAADIIIIDSVANLVPQKEIEGEMGDSVMGIQARLMSQALRKLTGIVAKNNIILIFINQLRDKIGVMFGNPETTTGGNALKFYASMRIDVRRIAYNKDGDVIVSSRTKVKVAKNKLAPPFKTAEFNILYGVGIDKTSEIIEIGSNLGVIQKSGSWFSYNGTKIGQGTEKVKQLFKDNPALEEEIRIKIKQKLEN